METTEVRLSKSSRVEYKEPQKIKTIRIRDIFLVGIGVLAGILIGLLLPSRLPGARIALSDTLLADGEIALEAINNKILEWESGYSGSTGLAALSNRSPEYIATNRTFDAAQALGTLPTGDQESFVSSLLENTSEPEEYIRARWRLYKIIVGYGLNEIQGLAVEAFLRTPRQLFVREKNLARAYHDTWLSIGYGATITDPDVVAMMTTTLDVKPGMKVLEIGTGSGYQSAILSNLTNEVYSIEIIEPLYYETNELYKELAAEYPSYNNISRKLGDGYYGWIKYAPFDRIIVTCAIDHLPPPLQQQLSPGGIMVVPLGRPGRQYIMEVKKTVDEEGNIVITRRDVYNGLSVKFIPFRNESGTSYSSK